MVSKNLKKDKIIRLKKETYKINVSEMVKIIRKGKEIRDVDGPKFYGSNACSC